VGALTQALVAPVALVALPVACLLLVTRSRRPLAVATGIASGLLAASWLLSTGELPDQVMRSAAVMATAAFAVTSARTQWTFTHRALFSLAVAAAGLAGGFLVLGWSWDRLHWWVSFRAGAALRLVMAATVPQDPGVATVNLDQPGFEDVLRSLVQTTADLFPAALALQLLISLALAAAVVPRIARAPVGRPLDRLSDFRFSEHLGWVLAVSLVMLLVPGLGRARPVALNLLVVMGVLYGVRGIAVVTAGLRAVGGGVLLYAIAAIAIFFLLPAVVLLGVLDAGLNLRRRRAPRPGA
jgi:Predicted membrane protein (DUF2232)